MDENEYSTALDELFEKALQIRRQAQELYDGIVGLRAASAGEPAGRPNVVDEETEEQLRERLSRDAIPS